MRIFLALSVYLANPAYSFAQTEAEKRKVVVENTVFSASHFSLTLIPHLTKKAQISRKSGNYDLTSSNMEGIEAGGNYHINFSKTYSLIIGLHGGAGARNFRLSIPKEEYTPDLKNDVDASGALTRTFDFYMSAPVHLERRWQHNRNHWNLGAGLNVRYYPDEFREGIGSYYQDVNGQLVEVYDFDLWVGNEYKPWLNYHIGGGYSWLLRNNNFLRINLLGNMSGKELVRGTYIINVTGKEPTTGTYSANLSYIGLSLNYVFTGTNNRLRNLYEKEQK